MTEQPGASEPQADVEGARARVQAYLTSEGPIQLDAGGRMSVGEGSTRVFVEVAAHSGNPVTVVMVTAPILFQVPLTPDLFEWVAFHSDDWYFGHLALWRDEDDPAKGTLLLRHVLLGDYLDKDELLYAVYGVSGTADRLDDELVAQFGGIRFADT